TSNLYFAGINFVFRGTNNLYFAGINLVFRKTNNLHFAGKTTCYFAGQIPGILRIQLFSNLYSAVAWRYFGASSWYLAGFHYIPLDRRTNNLHFAGKTTCYFAGQIPGIPRIQLFSNLYSAVAWRYFGASSWYLAGFHYISLDRRFEKPKNE
nr:hypothetical protein [Tanacetum cinerariifolium]